VSYQQILYDVRDRIATITLNRPEQLNAWTDIMADEVYQAMHAAAADEDVRVIVLTAPAATSRGSRARIRASCSTSCRAPTTSAGAPITRVARPIFLRSRSRSLPC